MYALNVNNRPRIKYSWPIILFNKVIFAKVIFTKVIFTKAIFAKVIFAKVIILCFQNFTYTLIHSPNNFDLEYRTAVYHCI